MLVRIAVRLEMHGELRVLNVLIVKRVVPRMYMDFLEMKCVLMIGVDLFAQTLVLLKVPGMS